MRLAHVLVLACVVASGLLAGCGAPDPCAGKAGTCIALRVEGDVNGLDQLSITVDDPTPVTRPTAVESFSLPIQIALLLSEAPTGDVNVDVTALGDGKARGAGSTSITIKGDRGKGTVTLVAGASNLDMSVADLTGTDLAGLDLAGTDLEVVPVCGNHIVEAGEACDDGNTVNGDGCDPTCRYTGTLGKVAGHPGGPAHNDDTDGLYARFDTPTAMAVAPGAAKLYVTGGDSTIRLIDLADPANPVTSTLTGQPYVAKLASFAGSTLATATFDLPYLLTYLPYTGSLYVYDVDHHIDEVNITADTVGFASVDPSALISALGTSGENVVFFDPNTGQGGPASLGLSEFIPPSTQTTQLATSAQIAAVNAAGSDCVDIACASGFCYLPCGTNIVQVNTGDASSPASSFAGVAGTSGCTDGTLSSATFTNANHLTVDPTNQFLLVTDEGCGTLREVPIAGTVTTTSTVAGTVGAHGWNDGAAASALFDGMVGVAYSGTTAYVLDGGNNVVRSFDGTNVATIAGRPHIATPSAFSTTTPVADPNFAQPWSGLATDGTSIYGVDSQARVLKTGLVTGDTLELLPSLPAGTTSLNGVVIVGNTLYLASQANGTLSTCALDGTAGQVYAGTPGTNTPPMDGAAGSAVLAPSTLATNGTQLFFTDSSTLVRMIDLASGQVTTLAGTLGTTDNVDDTGTAAHFARLGAIVADDTYVYVADGVYFAPGPPPTSIRRITIATGVVTTIAGASDMLGHVDAQGTSARFGGITSLALDGESLFATESNAAVVRGLGTSSVVRQMVLSTGSVTTMLGKPDQSSFRPDVGLAARVNFPASLTYDATTRSLLFFDQGEFTIGRIE